MASKKKQGRKNGDRFSVPGMGQSERMLQKIQNFLEDRDFESMDEANAFLEGITAKLNAGEEPEVDDMSPDKRAQELIYDAWEAKRREERLKLAEQALALYPECADAYVILAEDKARTLEEAKEFYALGVAAGERALGEKFFRENKGSFWGILKTRGYMRARQGLYRCLWSLGQKEEAIAHCEEMLSLNPNDNQGVRYDLVAYLFETNDLDRLSRLIKKYTGDGSAFWQYSRALLAYYQSGENKKANRELRRALEKNPFVPAYLLEGRALPKELPEFYAFGSHEEAILYVASFYGGWYRKPDSLLWLARGTAVLLADLCEEDE